MRLLYETAKETFDKILETLGICLKMNFPQEFILKKSQMQSNTNQRNLRILVAYKRKTI